MVNFNHIKSAHDRISNYIHNTPVLTCENINEEINAYESELEELSDQLGVINKDIEMFSGSNKKLRKLGNLRGKLSQKVATITEEHKFFTDNTVCPTCTQSIEESFRIDKINDAKSKAKELEQGYKELEEAIRLEEERETNSRSLPRRHPN